MRFLSLAAVQALHDQSIKDHGGAPGLRDPGLLESAVLRAKQKAHYDPAADAPALAASLAWGLLRNHAFIDGNKRVALATLVVFLRRNGYKLVASQPEQVDATLRAAAGELDEQGWTAWVRAFSQQLA